MTFFLFMLACEPKPSGRTPLEHALECEELLGPFPRFSCSDALLVPVTKDGEALTNGSWDSNQCDAPAAFGKPCDPGFGIGRYTGLNRDGSPNEDVVYLTNCRDGGLGVIGHRFSTGDTCFLHVNLEKVNPYDTNIPTPSEDGYNEAWEWPNIVAYDQCQECHMAGPFLHTPATSQLSNPENPSELLIPLTGHSEYQIVGAEFEQPHTTNIQNSCTNCHRAQCTEHFQNYPLDELLMPPPFSGANNFDHSNISTNDRDEIREWCSSLNLRQQESVGE